MTSDHDRTRKLREHLERLGEAVRSAMLEDPEIRRELASLRAAGWDSSVRFEARLIAVDQSDTDTSLEKDLRLTVTPGAAARVYQIDARDVRWLHEIGITAGRHRSSAGVRRTSENER